MTDLSSEQLTITQSLDALLDKRAKLVDDVRYYSGNEKAGYAEIAALDGEIVKHVIANRTTSLAAQDDPIEHVASTNSMYHVMDVDGLNRWREHASEGGGHDMASLNKNSLRRLIGTIDKLAAMASASSLAAQDGLVEALEYMLRVFDETNANDYEDVHLMVKQSAKITSIADCRQALSAIKGDKS